MTNRTSDTYVEQHVRDTPAPAGTDADRPIRTASLVAGIGLLLMAALGAFGNLVAVEGLVTPGDAARTAGDILASDGVFRLAVASLYLVVVLDVLVAWALLRVFSPVSRDISRLAAWFRLAYAAVFMVALSQLAGVPALLNSAGYSMAFTAEQRQAQAMLKIEAFNDIWSAGLVLFGVHLLVIGYLAYQSGYVPKLLGDPARHRRCRLRLRQLRHGVRRRFSVRRFHGHLPG